MDLEGQRGRASDLTAVPSGGAAQAAGGRADSRGGLLCYCSACGSRLVAREADRGRLVVCPHCLRETGVPQQPLGPGEPGRAASLFERERILSLWMRFLCPRCDSKLATDARAGGMLAECPRCGGRVRVPLLPGLVSPDPGSSRATEAGPAAGEVPASVAGKDTGAVLSADEICFLTAGSHG